MSKTKRKVVRLAPSKDDNFLVFSHEAVPDLSPHEVLVRVRASSLNYHDFMVMSGMSDALPGRIPLADGAGVVAAVGSHARQFSPGDNVLGTFFPHWLDGPPIPSSVREITGDSCDGFAAELVVMDEKSLTRMPRGMSFEQAATIPCAGVTAWCAIAEAGGVGANQVVVVQGTGGVSLWALQLAKSMGAKVIALTSSKKKFAALESLGADFIVDRSLHPDWSSSARKFTNGKGVDLVVEVIGGNNLSQSIASCRMGGQIAALGFLSDTLAEITLPNLLLNRISIAGLAVGSHADQLDLIEFIEKYSINPVAEEIWKFEYIKHLLESRRENRDVFGKYIISMQ